jgi:hypothetical protein
VVTFATDAETVEISNVDDVQLADPTAELNPRLDEVRVPDPEKLDADAEEANAEQASAVAKRTRLFLDNLIM